MKKSPLQNGDIVLVPFPFTNLLKAKLRPAVIISHETIHFHEGDATLLFISSIIPRKPEPHELIFKKDHVDFEKSGLKKDSVFKTNKITTIQIHLIKKKLGVLGDAIRKELARVFERTVSL